MLKTEAAVPTRERPNGQADPLWRRVQRQAIARAHRHLYQSVLA